MLEVWFFIAVSIGGMGNGHSVTQVGPFETRAACEEVSKRWVEWDRHWHQSWPCYQVLKPEAFPCYQRMQQAMKAMEESHRIKPYHRRSAEEKERDYQQEKARLDQWESTMKDCVRQPKED